MAERVRKKARTTYTVGNLLNSGMNLGINDGISDWKGKNPEKSKLGDLKNQLDHKELRKVTKDAYNRMLDDNGHLTGYTSHDVENAIRERIAEEVASGNSFSESGRAYIQRGGFTSQEIEVGRETMNKELKERKVQKKIQKKERISSREKDLNKYKEFIVPQLLGDIQKGDPRFSGKLIEKYLNNPKIEEYIESYAKGRKSTDNFSSNFRDTFGGANLGNLLTEDGKMVILDQDSRGAGEKFKSYLGGYFPTTAARGQAAKQASRAKGGNAIGTINEYLKTYIPFTDARKKFKKNDLNKTVSAFKDLYEIMQSDSGYAERMPDLAKAVTQVYDAGFFEAASKSLFKNNIINPFKYRTMKNAIHKEIKSAQKYVKKTLEDEVGKMPDHYIMPQKATGAILGIVGLGVLLSANNITGAVIGASQTSPIAFLWGTASLVLGAWLWMKKK